MRRSSSCSLSASVRQAYCALVAAGSLETVANVLVIAGAFYAFVIQQSD